MIAERCYILVYSSYYGPGIASLVIKLMALIRDADLDEVSLLQARGDHDPMALRNQALFDQLALLNSKVTRLATPEADGFAWRRKFRIGNGVALQNVVRNLHHMTTVEVVEEEYDDQFQLPIENALPALPPQAIPRKARYPFPDPLVVPDDVTRLRLTRIVEQMEAAIGRGQLPRAPDGFPTPSVGDVEQHHLHVMRFQAGIFMERLETMIRWCNRAHLDPPEASWESLYLLACYGSVSGGGRCEQTGLAYTCQR